MIEFLIERLAQQFGEFWNFMRTNYDPVRDTIDIALVFFAVYWLFLLIKGTRAVQILAGLMALIAARLISELFQLMTLTWILDAFFFWGWVIIIVVFQADIRRILARVGRGFFPQLSELQESHILEEIVRASQALAQKRVGALIVLERENGLEDLIEAGTPIDAAVSKELLTSLFLPYSPLHDGAVVIREGRISHAGSILPLTLRPDLPEGVGTRHRAAVGITEEADAVVIVVSEETGTISVVMAGEMTRDLDPGCGSCFGISSPAASGSRRPASSRWRRPRRRAPQRAKVLRARRERWEPDEVAVRELRLQAPGGRRRPPPLGGLPRHQAHRAGLRRADGAAGRAGPPRRDRPEHGRREHPRQGKSGRAPEPLGGRHPVRRRSFGCQAGRYPA
jgi:uncharacterized protein (TIGR00159 family)